MKNVSIEKREMRTNEEHKAQQIFIYKRKFKCDYHIWWLIINDEICVDGCYNKSNINILLTIGCSVKK